MSTDFQNSFTNSSVRKFSMYTSQRFPPHLNVLLHYLVKFENPKCYQIFTLKNLNLIFKKINVRFYVNCHKNTILMILLNYVYNIRRAKTVHK